MLLEHGHASGFLHFDIIAKNNKGIAYEPSSMHYGFIGYMNPIVFFYIFFLLGNDHIRVAPGLPVIYKNG